MTRKLALIFGLVAIACPETFAQDREIVTHQPAHRGEVASAPVQPHHHVRNEGGSDGAGLCVISSILANGMYQGVPGFDQSGYDEWTESSKPGKGSALWRAAKKAPGGYSPEKLQRLVDRVVPGEKYASHVGTDPEVLDRLSRDGYPIAVTMNTGELYQGKPIHHFVSLLHYRSDGAACFMDNNDKPGVYRWLAARTFAGRSIDGGVLWAWIWTRKAPSGSQGVLILLAAVLIIVVKAKRRKQRDGQSYEQATSLFARDLTLRASPG